MGPYINTTTIKHSQVYNIFMTLALFTLGPSNSALRCTVKWNEHSKNIQSHFIYHSPKVETVQMFVNRTDSLWDIQEKTVWQYIKKNKTKQNNYYVQQRGWLSQMMSKEQIQQTPHCTIPFIRRLRQPKGIYRHWLQEAQKEPSGMMEMSPS